MPPPSASVLTGEVEQDPELWLRVIAWVTISLSLVQVLAFSFGRDQGIYGVVAEGILRGQVPYRDLWDFKPPGIFFIYAGSFALFGKSMLAPRLIEVVFLFGAVLGLRRLGGVFFQSRTAGLLAGAIYVLVHAQLDFWHTGQPESFAGPLTIYALVVTTHDWGRKRRPLAWIAVGLLFGLAFVLKPPFGGGAIACAYYLSAHRRREGASLPRAFIPFLWIGLASLIPILITGAWFWYKGGWPALSWTLFEFAPGYTELSWVNRSAGGMFFLALSEGFFGYSSLLAFGVVAAASIHPRAQGEREAFMLILGVLAFQFVGIAIQGKFFQYHFGASVPLIALIAAQGYLKLWRRIALGSLSGSVVFALFMILAASMRLPVNDTPEGFWHRNLLRLEYLLSGGRSLSRAQLDEKLHYVGGYNLDGAKQTALELSQHVAPGRPIYIWGFEPVIYSLSHTLPSSRYIYNVPQRATWQSQPARAGLLSDLRRNPPDAIVTQRRDAMHFVTGNPLDSTDSLPLFPEFESYLTARFVEYKSIDRFTLWLPRGHSRNASSTAEVH